MHLQLRVCPQALVLFDGARQRAAQRDNLRATSTGQEEKW